MEVLIWTIIKCVQKDLSTYCCRFGLGLFLWIFRLLLLQVLLLLILQVLTFHSLKQNDAMSLFLTFLFNPSVYLPQLKTMELQQLMSHPCVILVFTLQPETKQRNGFFAIPHRPWTLLFVQPTPKCLGSVSLLNIPRLKQFLTDFREV